jgi:hypothetical protein
MKNPAKPDKDLSPGMNDSFTRKTALITGATSGIGKAYAEYFASQGYDLLITGRRREVILDVASELKFKYAMNIDVVIADLSKSEDISRLLQAIGRRKDIEVLVNNAGYGMDQKFSEDHLSHQLAMLKVHVHTPLRLIHKVLPAMKSKHSGIIINVSSLAASFPTSGNAMYTSTKLFLKNFTESLHMDVCNYGIRIQCLCPGFTRSDFHRNHLLSGEIIKQELVQWMKPSDVVSYSISCLNKGQVVCIPGFLNRFLELIAHAVPRRLYYLMASKTEKKIRMHRHLPDLAFMPGARNKTA